MQHSSLPITGEILFMMISINEFEGTSSLTVITSNPEPTEDIEHEELGTEIPLNPKPYTEYCII